MTQKLTKEQYWKLFNNLSEEMKDVILSEKTAADIFDICERNEIDDVSRVADYIGQTLLGVLAPNNLQETLKNELGFKEAQAQTVMQEINRFILYPVKPILEELYNTEILPKNAEKKSLKPETSLPEKKPIPTGPDTYRESVE